MQQNLFESEELEEGVANPFYDPIAAEEMRIADEEVEKELQRIQQQKQKEIEEAGLEYQICCAHVSKVDGSAYAVRVLEGYDPEYAVYSNGLPEGVEAKRCDCEGKGVGWRGGEIVNRMFDKDERERCCDAK